MRAAGSFEPCEISKQLLRSDPNENDHDAFINRMQNASPFYRFACSSLGAEILEGRGYLSSNQILSRNLVLGSRWIDFPVLFVNLSIAVQTNLQISQCFPSGKLCLSEQETTSHFTYVKMIREECVTVYLITWFEVVELSLIFRNPHLRESYSSLE